MKVLIRYSIPYIVLILIGIVATLLNIEVRQYVTGLTIGIIASYYFVYDNPYKRYQVPIVILIMFWVISIHLTVKFDWSMWVSKSVLISLVLVYLLRFWKRSDKLPIDYVKSLGVMILPVASFLYTPSIIIILIFLGFLFILDRLIIRKNMNKTAQIVLFSFLAFITTTLVIVSFIKADEAEKASLEARITRMEAEENAEEAERQKSLAEASAAEAMKQRALAEEAMAQLMECKKR